MLACRRLSQGRYGASRVYTGKGLAQVTQDWRTGVGFGLLFAVGFLGALQAGAAAIALDVARILAQ